MARCPGRGERTEEAREHQGLVVLCGCRGQGKDGKPERGDDGRQAAAQKLRTRAESEAQNVEGEIRRTPTSVVTWNSCDTLADVRGEDSAGKAGGEYYE